MLIISMKYELDTAKLEKEIETVKKNQKQGIIKICYEDSLKVIVFDDESDSSKLIEEVQRTYYENPIKIKDVKVVPFEVDVLKSFLAFSKSK